VDTVEFSPSTATSRLHTFLSAAAGRTPASGRRHALQVAQQRAAPVTATARKCGADLIRPASGDPQDLSAKPDFTQEKTLPRALNMRR
jgi:hypothetical protein